MGFLERLRLRKKRARPVGKNLEKSREGPAPSPRTQYLIKAAILVGLVLATLLAFPRENLYEYTVHVGEEWQQENLQAPFDFAVYKNVDTLRAERERVRRTTPPFFRELPRAQERMRANRDTVAQQLARVFEAYESYLYNRQRGRTAEARRDSLRFLDLRSGVRPKLTPAQWDVLKEDIRERMPGAASTTRIPPTGPPLYMELLDEAWQLGTELVNTGVLNVPLDSVRTDRIVIRNEEEHTERTTRTEYLYGLNEVYSYAREEFQETYEEHPARANIAATLFQSIFQPSLQYMRAETLREWQSKQQRISPTRGKVEEGDQIVAQGEVVTEEVRRKLLSLERAREERSGSRIVWRRALGQFLLTLCTFFVFFLYVYLLRKQIFENNKEVLLISLLFIIIIVLFAVAIRVSGVAMFAVPVAVISVLLTVMFDSRVGIFGTLTLAIIGALLLGFDFEFFFATMFAGVLAVFSVRDIKNRGQFFISGGLVFVGYAIVIIASWLFLSSSPARLGTDLLYVGIHAFLVILALPLLWVFERTFDITTDLTLLEMSDTNRPLLKELSLRAPGTFQHSLQVANLAEAAAASVGANALLARVGALYHDVGKMLKPEYFVENQRGGRNPHDQLKPRMSALIIASHVKEGMEMGRQYNLPRRVLNFIPTHHGTTRIEYFYRKALDQRAEEDPEVLESEFRYPGPRPNSAETGILLLADSVEAASRSLDEPTHKKLDSLIEMIFRARIDDGQLDDCELTFRDLRIIKETFLSVLLGVHHGRVEYPGQKKEMPLPEKAVAEEEVAEGAEAPAEATLPEDPLEESDPVGDEEGVVGVPEQSVRSLSAAEEREADAEQRPPRDEGDVETNGAPEQAAERGAPPEEEGEAASRTNGTGSSAETEAGESADEERKPE